MDSLLETWATGVVTTPPEILYNSLGQAEVTLNIRCDLENGDRAEWIRLHFKGDVAIVAANINRGDMLIVLGTPSVHAWLTHDGRAQARMDVEVKAVQAIYQGDKAL